MLLLGFKRTRLFRQPRAESLRRFTYIVVVAAAVHLSGLRALCVRSVAPAHECCPQTHSERSDTSSASLPNCCVVSALWFEGSVAEVRSNKDAASTGAYAYQTPVLGVMPKVVPNPISPRAFSNPTSPPLSPLLQTCLLLI